MVLLSICNNADVLNVIRIVKLLLNILRIVVPIMLILSVSLDFLSAVASNDQDLVKKATGKSIKKAIAAIIIFLVPVFINIVVEFSSGEGEYSNCMSNATVENINVLYTQKASELMVIAIRDVSHFRYQEAKDAVSKIVDEDLKYEYEIKLEEIKLIIDAEDAIAVAARSKSQKDYQKAVDAVSKVKDEDERIRLNDKLVAISNSSTTNEYSSGGGVVNASGIPYYNQDDVRWGGLLITKCGDTIGSAGCGYTSLAMVAAGLNGDMSIIPNRIVLDVHNGVMPIGGCNAAIPDEALIRNSIMNKYNLNASVIFKDRNRVMSNSEKQNLLYSALNSGKVVILLTPGHYMVLVPDNGGIVLLDPKWTSRNKRYENLDKLQSRLYQGGDYGTFIYAIAYSRK